MSYDYIAQGMWGMGGQTFAEREVRKGVAAGKINPRGVKMYDMKQNRISYFDREKWKQKWAGEIYEVAASIEGAQAFLNAGWIDEAENYEKTIAGLQRPDGGFPTAFFGPFSGGSETIFTAGRFILMERQMTDVIILKNQGHLIGMN